MKDRERLIIYPLLAIIALAAFLDLRPIQAQREPGEGIFRKLTIVDEKGRKVIELGVAEGRPRFFLTDPGEKSGILLTVFHGRPNLSVLDNGKMMVSLGVNNGEPILTLFDQNGNPGVGVGILEGQPGLKLYGRNGKSLLGLTMIQGKHPQLGLFDQDGKPRVGLALLDGEPNLQLRSGKGKGLVSLGIVKGIGGLSFSDESGKQRVYLFNWGEPGGELMFTDKNGKRIWSAP